MNTASRRGLNRWRVSLPETELAQLNRKDTSSSAGFSSFSSTVITSASHWWTPRRRRAASVHLSPAGIKSRCQPESVWVILLLRHTLPAACINCGNTWLKLSIRGEHLVTKTMITRTNAGFFNRLFELKVSFCGAQAAQQAQASDVKVD